MWTKRRWLVLYVFMILEIKNAVSNPVSTKFNANIRDYSLHADDINATNVKTLQKEETGRYAGFAPVQDPTKYREVPDNALSSSSYSRGLLHHDHGGYGLHGYEEHHPGYIPDYADNYDQYHPGVYAGHHQHHVGYGHHHKHYDHGLATKALLWPIAGIALLGAAAALVTNPVLLQLGVISGRRRRRDTDDVSSEVNLKTLKNWSLHGEDNTHIPAAKRVAKKKLQNEKRYKMKPVWQKGPLSTIGTGAVKDQKNYDYDDKLYYVPIPLRLKAD